MFTMDQSKEEADVSERPFDNGSVPDTEFYDKSIPEKWKGTVTDKDEMVVMGKKQVLRVFTFPCVFVCLN